MLSIFAMSIICACLGLIFIFLVVILLSRFPQKQGLPFSSKRNVLHFSFFLVIQIWYSNVIWRTSTQETSEVLRLTVRLFSLFDWFVTCDGSNMIATEMLQWRKLAWSQTSVASVTLHLKIWIDIWKHTVEKSRTNAASATLHSYKQANWRYIQGVFFNWPPPVQYQKENRPTSQPEAFFYEEFHVTAALIGWKPFFFSVLKMGRSSLNKTLWTYHNHQNSLCRRVDMTSLITSVPSWI